MVNYSTAKHIIKTHSLERKTSVRSSRQTEKEKSVSDSIDDQPKISADGSQELGGLGKRSADIPVEKLEKINHTMQGNSYNEMLSQRPDLTKMNDVNLKKEY